MPLLTRPGIAEVNWGHPANRNLRFSLAPGGASGAVDMASGTQGVLSGTIAGGATQFIGNTLNFNSSGAVATFNRVAQTPKIATIATMLRVTNSVGASCGFFADGSVTTSIALDMLNGGTILFRVGTNTVSATTNSLVANAPFLIAASFLSGVNVNFLVMRLDTGVVSTCAVSTTATSPLTSGIYTVGTQSAVTANFGAVLYSNTYFPTAQALADAFVPDPWGPWRPPVMPIELMSARQSFNPAWARGSSRNFGRGTPNR